MLLIDRSLTVLLFIFAESFRKFKTDTCFRCHFCKDVSHGSKDLHRAVHHIRVFDVGTNVDLHVRRYDLYQSVMEVCIDTDLNTCYVIRADVTVICLYFCSSTRGVVDGVVTCLKEGVENTMYTRQWQSGKYQSVQWYYVEISTCVGFIHSLGKITRLKKESHACVC